MEVVLYPCREERKQRKIGEQIHDSECVVLGKRLLCAENNSSVWKSFLLRLDNYIQAYF